MGDHREQFVDLTTPLTAAEGRVEEAREWLLWAGWSTSTAADDWLFPTAAFPRCGATAGDRFWDTVSIWSTQVAEPVLACSRCGFHRAGRRVGPQQFSAVGSVAVVVDLYGGAFDPDHAI